MSIKSPNSFNTSNLPEVAMPIFSTDGERIGTFNPHTMVIHPHKDSPHGAMKLLGRMAFDMDGHLIGHFTETGCFEACH